MLRNKVLIQFALGALLALLATPAMATTSIPAGFGSDDGTTHWMGDSLIAAFEPPIAINAANSGAVFGLYFEGAPTTLVPIFGSGTAGGSAYLHMAWGLVQTGPTIFSGHSFNASTGAFGFYVQINGETIYTDEALNANGGSVTTHSDGNGSYVLSFTINGEEVAVEQLNGLSSYAQSSTGGGGPFGQGDGEGECTDCQGGPNNPVPEPQEWLVFMIGLAVVLYGVERHGKAAVEAEVEA